jgi:hypothetical protein
MHSMNLGTSKQNFSRKLFDIGGSLYSCCHCGFVCVQLCVHTHNQQENILYHCILANFENLLLYISASIALL